LTASGAPALFSALPDVTCTSGRLRMSRRHESITNLF
jgi:hypothetical protein